MGAVCMCVGGCTDNSESNQVNIITHRLCRDNNCSLSSPPCFSLSGLRKASISAAAPVELCSQASRTKHRPKPNRLLREDGAKQGRALTLF